MAVNEWTDTAFQVGRWLLPILGGAILGFLVALLTSTDNDETTHLYMQAQRLEREKAQWADERQRLEDEIKRQQAQVEPVRARYQRIIAFLVEQGLDTDFLEYLAEKDKRVYVEKARTEYFGGEQERAPRRTPARG